MLAQVFSESNYTKNRKRKQIKLNQTTVIPLLIMNQDINCTIDPQKQGSQSSQYLPRHSCVCKGICMYQLCPCSQILTQNCLQNDCCFSCVPKKKESQQRQCKICMIPEQYEQDCKCFINKQSCGYQFCLYIKFQTATNKKKKKKKELIETQHNPHFKLCLCKKSQCSKKYCECFAAGKACNRRCQCEGCENQLTDKINIKDKSTSSDKKVSLAESDQADSVNSIGQFLNDEDDRSYQMPAQIEFTEFKFKK